MTSEINNGRPGSNAGFADKTRQAVEDLATGAAEFARVAAPRVKRNAARFGDWLARIGWGKFLLLSILLLILGGMATSLIFERSPAVVIDKGDPSDRVNVVVSVTPEGLKIAPPPRPNAPGCPLPAPGVE